MRTRIALTAATVLAVGVGGLAVAPAQAAGKYSVTCKVGGNTEVAKPGSMTEANYSFFVNGTQTPYTGWTTNMSIPTPANATKVIVLLGTGTGTLWNMGVGCR